MMLPFLDILCCPIDQAFPLADARKNAPTESTQHGLLRCPKCETVFAVIDGVPHLTRPQIREIEIEREGIAKLPGDSYPADWLTSIRQTWDEAERTRTQDDLRLIEEGRYWGKFFRAHADQNAWTVFDARQRSFHLPYLPYGCLAVDDRDRYRVHDHWPNPLGRRILQFFDETLSAGATRYLDFACGGGQFGLEACYRGAQSIGFDLAADALSLAAQYARKHELDARYVRAEPTALPFREGIFDAMVVKDALHHFPDVYASLDSANRVLKEHADVLAIEHVADKPRWEKLRTKILLHYLEKIMNSYPRTSPLEFTGHVSPFELAGSLDLEKKLTEKVDVTERRGELLFADEITLPIYLASGRQRFPAEWLSRIIYRFERLALLWGRPRFIYVRGRMK